MASPDFRISWGGLSKKMDEKRKLIPEGLFIAGIPFIGYLAAFTYEYGYALHYGIPVELISISLDRVLYFLGALVGLLFIIFYAVHLVYIVCQHNRGLLFALFLLAPVLVLGIALTCIYDYKIWAWYWGVLLFFASIWFVPPLLTHKDKGSYEERYRASVAGEPDTLYNLAVRVVGLGVTELLMWVAVFLFIAYHLGQGRALYQQDYWVDSSEPNTVVLRFYGDTVISHEYDAKTLKLAGDFLVTKLSSKQKLRFQEKSLGHLKR